MTLGKIIDWIGKNLGRIKTVGLLLVIVLLAISIARSGCDRSDIEELIEKVTGLNVQNDILNNDIKARDTILMQKEHRILGLLDSIDQSEGRFKRLERTYTHLEDEYQSLSDSLLTIPADTSYEYLQTEAYPYQGELKYPFNDPQVKGIHLTFLEKLTLADMNTILQDQVGELSFISDTKDSVTEEYQASMLMLKKDTSDMRQIIGNMDQIIEVQGDHIRKRKKKDRRWKIIGGAVIVILAAFAAGGS
jgi:hypothetical protein